MTHIETCPICRGTAFEKDLLCKDYTVSGELFQLLVCVGCGFKFTSPRPENEVLGKYYESEEYISHSNTKKGIVSKLYHFVRAYTLGKKMELLGAYVSRGTVLDYGCGTGMFLDCCRKGGWNTVGIEPDLGAREIAKKAGLTVFESKESLSSAQPEMKFNAISLWHVLEHVTDLEKTLNFIKDRLDSKGALIIAVPNFKSFDARYYGKYWAAYDVPRHLYHFELKTMVQLLSEFDFTLVKTKAMKFDSFYVSMLSEKYKNGAVRYLSAVWFGLMSNLSAKSSSDYSSVIYVFKRR